MHPEENFDSVCVKHLYLQKPKIDAYHKDAWWWEVFEMWRKLMLAGVRMLKSQLCSDFTV